jgi:hypothetical protein
VAGSALRLAEEQLFSAELGVRGERGVEAPVQREVRRGWEVEELLKLRHVLHLQAAVERAHALLRGEHGVAVEVSGALLELGEVLDARESALRAEGLLLVGDALCFLDPVFSSGILLAFKSGVMAADAVHEAIVAGDYSPNRFGEYGRVLRDGLENMRKLVYAFYNPNFSFKQVIDKDPTLAGDITDCLSGDLTKDFTRLWKAIEEFAPLPEELTCGAPLEKNSPTLQSV